MVNKVWYVKKHYNLTHDDLIEPCLSLDDDVQVYSINFKKIDLKNYRPQKIWLIIPFCGKLKYISLEKNNE